MNQIIVIIIIKMAKTQVSAKCENILLLSEIGVADLKKMS